MALVTTDEQAIKRYSQAKAKRDDIQNRHVQFTAKVDAARDRYNAIMNELKQFDINSLEELRTKIEIIVKQINLDLDAAEKLMVQIEEEERAFDANKVV